MKRKTILIVLGAVIAVIFLAAGGFYYMSTQPLYKPGMVAAGKNLRSPLTHPAQTGDPGFWQVESDIQLYHPACLFASRWLDWNH